MLPCCVARARGKIYSRCAQLSSSRDVLAHTVWVDCRQLAADAEQAEAAHQSAASAARAELETQVGDRLLCLLCQRRSVA